MKSSQNENLREMKELQEKVKDLDDTQKKVGYLVEVGFCMCYVLYFVVILVLCVVFCGYTDIIPLSSQTVPRTEDEDGEYKGSVRNKIGGCD